MLYQETILYKLLQLALARHSIATTTIAGRSRAEYTVNISQSRKVVGSQTLFKRFFKTGDTIFFKSDSYYSKSTRIFENTIAHYFDDENMEPENVAGFTNSTNYYVKTNVYETRWIFSTQTV